jgi:hypothetical protein
MCQWVSRGPDWANMLALVAATCVGVRVQVHGAMRGWQRMRTCVRVAQRERRAVAGRDW